MLDDQRVIAGRESADRILALLIRRHRRIRASQMDQSTLDGYAGHGHDTGHGTSRGTGRGGILLREQRRGSARDFTENTSAYREVRQTMHRAPWVEAGR